MVVLMRCLPECHWCWWGQVLCSTQTKRLCYCAQLQTITQHGKLIKEIRLFCGDTQRFLRGHWLQEVAADGGPLTRPATKCRHSWMGSSFECLRERLKGYCSFSGFPLKRLSDAALWNPCEASLSWLKYQGKWHSSLHGNVGAPNGAVALQPQATRWISSWMKKSYSYV